MRITLHFFKLVSYLVRYNWAWINGKIKEKDNYKGLAYDDYVAVNLDDIEEKVLAVVKEYSMDYSYVSNEMYYPDVTVYYAKMANNNAFKSYNDYLNLDEQSQGKYVTDWGVPEPYVYEILTPDKQQKAIEAKNRPSTNTLKDMYRHGGRLND